MMVHLSSGFRPCCCHIGPEAGLLAFFESDDQHENNGSLQRRVY